MDNKLLEIINETRQLRTELHDQAEALAGSAAEAADTLRTIEERLGAALVRLTDVAYTTTPGQEHRQV